MRSKLILPAHESHIARDLGDEMLRALYAATEHFPHPIPVAMTRAMVYKGGLIPYIAGGGFSSLSDLISEATTGGKAQHLQLVKSGTAGTAGRSNSLWNVGPVPAAGGVGGAAGTGVAKTRASTGALVQKNPAGGDTLHLVGGTFQGSVGTQMLLIYDRLWDMTMNMTTDPLAVDGVNPPTRYQSSTSAPGNFLSGEVTTVFANTSITATFTYEDQDGNTPEAGAAVTLLNAAAVNTVPFAVPNWFYPLNAGDTGLRRITNVDLSAALASGVVSWFIGHPLALVPMPTANIPVLMDGINTAFNLAEVQTDACLAFMEIAKGATTATSWWADLILVSG